MNEQTIVAIIAGALGTMGTYLAARRRQSGKVAMTDADKLWREEEQFREGMQHVIDGLRQRVDALEVDKARCLEELAKLQGEVARLKEMVS